MAGKGSSKASNGMGDGRSRIKFRFVDIEMENVDQSITEGLKSLANALSRGHVVGTPARQLAPVKPVAATSAGATPEDEEGMPPDEQIESLAEEAEGEPDAGSFEEGKPKKKYAPKAPKFLSDLDLTKATVSLSQYVEEKNPQEMLDRYAVIAEWFKEYMATEEITIDHVFTAFRHLGVQSQLPPDVGQPLRDLKSKKHWFDQGSARGTYKINWNGTSAVNKMGVAA